MPLTVHHLQFSQSERIPWLCEELGVPYTLILHQRAPYTAPQSIRDLNPLNQAPIIQDGGLTLVESAACVEYIIHKHGGGRLVLPPSHPNYSDYLYGFHAANSNLQTQILVLLMLQNSGVDSDSPVTKMLRDRLTVYLGIMDEDLKKNTWLAGEEFTAADIMTVFSLTTMRVFYPLDLTGYEGILAYLERATGREAYKKARARADPEMEIMIEGKPPKSFVERLKQ